MSETIIYKFRLIKYGNNGKGIVVGHERHVLQPYIKGEQIHIEHRHTNSNRWKDLIISPYSYIPHDHKDLWIWLKDKNGVEIYSNDIAEEETWTSPEMSFDLRHNGVNRFTIVIPDIFYRMGRQLAETLSEEVEQYKSGGFFTVIGNIHENPELLKGKTNA